MKPIGSEKAMVATEPSLDQYGEVVPGTGDPVEIKGCAFWSAGTSEEAFRAATTTEDLVLAAPVAIDALAANMTVTRPLTGRTYNIDGEPIPWLSLSGVLMGVQANLKRAS